MAKKTIKLSDIVASCKCHVACGADLLERKAEGGYASDLLSDVMANSKKDDIWITLQGHPNIVAVARLKEIVGIIIVNGRKPEKETLKKAESENIVIMTTDLTTFELVGKLYEMGISGQR
jgi:hypothetical protein